MARASATRAQKSPARKNTCVLLLEDYTSSTGYRAIKAYHKDLRAKTDELNKGFESARQLLAEVRREIRAASTKGANRGPLKDGTSGPS